MKTVIRTLNRFSRRIAATTANYPAETFIILLFFIYALLATNDTVPAERCYTALYPIFLTVAFLCNTVSARHKGQKRHPMRLLYYASTLLPLFFLKSDVSGFVNSTSYFISLILCPLSVFAAGLKKENLSYVSQSTTHIKNAVYAASLSGMTFVLLYAIYLSFTYIFFPENSQPYHMADITTYLLIFSFLLFMPFAFLAFTRKSRENTARKRVPHTLDIAGIAINYIMTPALLVYTCMLYIYFASILITWTLPKGGIAMMVFIYTMAAMAARAVHMTIRKQHVFARFYTRFSFISLPALIMFWIGVWYRISEYGFTQARVYLVICGVIMTATMVLFFSEKYGRFLVRERARGRVRGVHRRQLRMKEQALVVKTAGRIAVVQIEKRPECAACKVCAFAGGKSRVKVKALNTAGAKAGDRVLVEAEKDNRALASFVVYIVPVLLGIAGVVIGAYCFEEELWAAVLCLAGLALGFVAVWAIDKLLSKRRGFGIEVVAVLDTPKTEKKEETDNGESDR